MKYFLHSFCHKNKTNAWNGNIILHWFTHPPKHTNKHTQACNTYPQPCRLASGFSAPVIWTTVMKNGSSVPCSLKSSTDTDMFTSCLTTHRFVETDMLLSPAIRKSIYLSLFSLPIMYTSHEDSRKQPKRKHSSPFTASVGCTLRYRPNLPWWKWMWMCN